MIALKIAEVKDFMNKLLCQDVFDHFLIQEAVITTNVSCHIDGTLQKGFYTLEELEEQNLTGLSFVPVSYTHLHPCHRHKQQQIDMSDHFAFL